MNSKVVLAGLVAFAAIAATVSAASVTTPVLPRSAPAAWQPLALEVADFPAGVTMPSQTSLVIGTAGAYAEFVTSLAGTSDRASEFPNVDFGTQFLVVASYGMKDLGNDLNIVSAKTDGAHVVVYLDQQVDNPDHCRVTHDVHFIGQLAIVQRSGTPDVTQDGTVGFVTTQSVMPYDDWYNCYCPEM